MASMAFVVALMLKMLFSPGAASSSGLSMVFVKRTVGHVLSFDDDRSPAQRRQPPWFRCSSGK
jgi:hypothetical protein